MSDHKKKLSMKKLSITVSIVAFSILVVVLVVILNFAKKEAYHDVMNDVTYVGLILNGSKDDRSWNQAHYDALGRISEDLNLEIVTVENVPEDASCTDAIKKLIDEDGCTVVIGTSTGYSEYIGKASEEYKDRYFLCTGGTYVSGNCGSFFGRMYQMRYLSGIVAGLQTKTGHIGYVAPFPISEINRGINAFTLGVRSVDPDAVVHVSYCGDWSDDEAAAKSAEKLISEYSADVITMQVDSLAPMRVAEEKGVWSIGNNCDTSDMFPNSFLTACEWHWDDYYRTQILLCKQGKFKGALEWLGSESGIVRLTPVGNTGNADERAEEMIRSVSAKFAECSFDVFYGPIKDTDGNIRVGENESMSDRNMLDSFDWYVEGTEIDSVQ